jgi:hypothetical protein
VGGFLFCGFFIWFGLVYLWDWGLNSGPHTCKAGALPLELLHQPGSFLVFLYCTRSHCASQASLELEILLSLPPRIMGLHHTCGSLAFGNCNLLTCKCFHLFLGGGVRDRVSLCSLDWLGTGDVASTSQVLGLQECSTTPTKFFF